MRVLQVEDSAGVKNYGCHEKAEEGIRAEEAEDPHKEGNPGNYRQHGCDEGYVSKSGFDERQECRLLRRYPVIGDYILCDRVNLEKRLSDVLANLLDEGSKAMSLQCLVSGIDKQHDNQRDEQVLEDSAANERPRILVTLERHGMLQNEWL